jgi:RimJ/RimL family protein N-acetyltransferase
LRDYFSDCLSSGFSYGVEFDGKFVSVTDAPTMPYMADTVQEIGINTHPKFYGKGYASVACLAMIEALLSRGLCPMWSTTADNLSSQALAKRVGFEPLAKTKLITWNGCR